MRRRTSRLRGLLDVGAAGDAGRVGSRRIAGSIGIGLAGRVVTLAVSLVALPLAARALGPEGFGVWTAALAYVGLFAAFTEFGLTNAAMQRMAADPEHEAQWLGALASLRTLFAGVATLVAAALIPLALSGDGDLRLAAVILLVIIPATGAGALMSLFQTRLRPAVPVLIGIGQSLTWLSLVVVLVLADGDVLAFAAAYAALMTGVAAVQIRVTRRHRAFGWDGMRDRWRSLLRIAVPIGLASLFITVYYKVDAVLLIELASAEEAGVYGAAYRFLEPLVFVPAAVMTALFPVLSAIRASDPARFERLVRRGAELMALVSLPGVAVTLVLGDQIVDLFYGAEFARAGGLLPILMGAYVSICFGTLAGFLAPIIGLQWRLAIFSGVGALANVVLNVLLIPEHGAYGAAWATLATEWLTMTLLFGTALWRLQLRLELGRIVAVVVACAVMAAVMLLVRPLGLVPALAAGAVVFPLAALGLRAVRPDELRALRAG
jgi:O-antigen/teichoic acid export membrane protein